MMNNTTGSKPFLGLKGTSLTWAITICSASSFLLFGYDQGIMGSIISTPYFLEALNITVSNTFAAAQRRAIADQVRLQATNTDTISTIVSIYDIGCMVGCLVAAVWGGVTGRKLMILMGSFIMIIGMSSSCNPQKLYKVADCFKAQYCRHHRSALPR